MPKILNQLSTLSLAPKTKKEKLFHWFYNNEIKIISRGLCIAFLVSFLMVPFVKNLIAPELLQVKPHLEGIDYADFFIGSMGICLTVWLCISALLSSWSKKSQTSLRKRYSQNLLNYLKTYQENKELEQCIIKIKLLKIYKSIPRTNLVDNLGEYIEKIENDSITEKDLSNAEMALFDYESSTYFFEENKEFLNKTIDEIKLMINQKIANKLKVEKEKHQTVDNFVNKFTQNDEAIFKQVKTLKTSL